MYAQAPMLICDRDRAVYLDPLIIIPSLIYSRADQFHVPPSFLVQQAAWLYERHLDHVRAQMKKVGGTAQPPPFNLDSTQTTMGGEPMRRASSSGSGGMRPLEPLNSI